MYPQGQEEFMQTAQKAAFASCCETLRPAKITYNVTVDLDYNENWK